MKTNVAIIGIGLIGGSLGQALRGSGKYRVLGIARKRRTLRTAKRLGAIDEGSTRLQDASRADIIVIATPVDDVVPTARKLFPVLRPGTLVTDVASVKGPILESISRLIQNRPIHFVGGHPLAGSHQTGVKAANLNLFRGSTCVLIPLRKAPLNALAALWRAAGARVRIMSAASHDAAVAVTSHLPHVLAYGLVLSVAGHRDRKMLTALLAGSFRDVTRVASSDPEQWKQIFQSNARPIRRALAGYKKVLARLEKRLGQPSLRADLKKSQTFRHLLFHGK